MITIRFVSHPSIFDWAVKRVQFGFWASHVDAVLPDGRLLGAHGDGVRILPADYDAGKFSRELHVSLNTGVAQDTKFFDYIQSQVGKPYDRWAIASFATNRDWQTPEHWFCSELIAAGLAQCGLFPQHLALGFSRITLRDLLLLTSLLTEVRDAR